ncbi:MAG: EamA family transporter [Planctomycetota bacterium]
MPYASFLFICTIWGASFILMERASHVMGPVDIGLWRLIGGSATLTAMILWTRGSWGVRRRDWPHIGAVALFANVYPFVVQPYVMIAAGEHAYFGMMVALVPLATILVSIPMLGVYPTRRQLFGVLGGLVCMAGVVQEGSARGISPWLLLLALTVPISYAVGNTYVKWKLEGLPAAPLTTLFLAMGAAMLLPVRLSPSSLETLGMAGPAEPYDWPVAIGSIAVLSILGTGIAILLFIRLIKNEGPLFAGMVTYVVPVLALAWGQYDNEWLSGRQVAAILGVLAMVAVVQWPARTPRPALGDVAAE